MSGKPSKEVTVKERCLVCQGEGWIPEPLEEGRSKPCPYCKGGWLEIRPWTDEKPQS